MQRSVLAQAFAIQPSTGPCFRRVCAFALASAALSFAGSAFAQDIGKETIDLEEAPATDPALDLPPTGTRGPLLFTGAAIFAGWYGAAVAESFMWPNAPEADKLRIPVVGPWITVANAGCGAGEPNCGEVLPVIRAIIEGLTAVAQIGGLAMMTEAAFLRTSDGAPAKPPKPKAFRTVTVVADGNRFGVGLVGAF